MKIITKNKQAKRDYELTNKTEAGIVLTGWEVKAIKEGKISIDGAFIREHGGELFLKGSRVYPLQFASVASDEEERDRKLLLNKTQIQKLVKEQKNVGYSLIPIEVYVNDRRLVKIQIGLGKGKKKIDKRNKLKEKDQKRAIDIDRKRYNF